MFLDIYLEIYLFLKLVNIRKGLDDVDENWGGDVLVSYNSREQELLNASEEQKKITKIRLEKLL